MDSLPDDTDSKLVEFNDSVHVGDISIVQNKNAEVLSCPQCRAKGNISLIPCFGSSPYEKDPSCIEWVCNYCKDNPVLLSYLDSNVRCIVCQGVYQRGEDEKQKLADEKLRLAIEEQRLAKEKQDEIQRKKDEEVAAAKRKTEEEEAAKEAEEERAKKLERRKELLQKRYWTRVAYVSMFIGIGLFCGIIYFDSFTGTSIMDNDDERLSPILVAALSFLLFIPWTIDHFLGGFYNWDDEKREKSELKRLNKELDES